MPLSHNRFGRIGELSSAFVLHKTLLEVFFEKQVDTHANKLVLAVHCYFTSKWFTRCCEVAKFFYESITLPIKKVLGID